MSDIPNKQGSPFKKRIAAFGHALRGVKIFFGTQWHARFHAIAAIIAVGLGVFLGLSPVEWCCVFFAIAMVMASEAINTAIEFLVDRVSTEHHPLSGKAKDVAAAAVLISAIGAAAVGAIIFGPKLWRLIF